MSAVHEPLGLPRPSVTPGLPGRSYVSHLRPRVVRVLRRLGALPESLSGPRGGPRRVLGVFHPYFGTTDPGRSWTRTPPTPSTGTSFRLDRK